MASQGLNGQLYSVRVGPYQKPKTGNPSYTRDCRLQDSHACIQRPKWAHRNTTFGHVGHTQRASTHTSLAFPQQAPQETSAGLSPGEYTRASCV
eukprot:1187046-Pyramimonas_sp.AAC.2